MTLVIVSLIVLHYICLETTEIFAIDQTIKMLVFFMLGVCCVDWSVASINKVLSNRILCIMCSLIIIGFIFISIYTLYFDNALKLFLPWLGIASVMIVSVLISKYVSGSFLNVVMIISASNYIIYLFHTTFEDFAKAALQKIGIQLVNNNSMFIIGAALVILCGIVCPILLHHFVLKKHKILKFMFGLKEQ